MSTNHLVPRYSADNIPHLPGLKDGRGGSISLFESGSTDIPGIWMEASSAAPAVSKTSTGDTAGPNPAAYVMLSPKMAWALAEQLMMLVETHTMGDLRPARAKAPADAAADLIAAVAAPLAAAPAPAAPAAPALSFVAPVVSAPAAPVTSTAANAAPATLLTPRTPSTSGTSSTSRPVVSSDIRVQGAMTDLIQNHLDDAHIHLATSEAGRGRNAVLTEQLETYLPGRYVTITENSLNTFSIGSMATELANAEIIYIDGFAGSSIDQKNILAELIAGKTVTGFVKYKASVGVKLREDVIIIVSEQDTHREQALTELNMIAKQAALILQETRA